MTIHTRATPRLICAVACALTAAACDTSGPAGSAWSLEPVSGDAQTAEVGTQVPAPVVRVLVRGRPLANVAVQWSADGSGSADRATRTDARGLARGMWWLGTTPGVHHLTASLGSSLAPPVIFTATAVAGSMARIYVRPRSGTLQNVRDSLPLVSAATDRLGNTVSSSGAVWTSIDPLTATVSSSGLVRGRAGGVARIVLSSGTLADTATVLVKQPALRVAVDPESTVITALTRTAQLQVTAWDEFGNLIRSPAVTWSSLSPGVAGVDARGSVTAVANGSAAIVARVDDAAATARVVVSQLVSDMAVTPLFPALLTGDSVRIAVAAWDAAHKPMPQAEIFFTSSNTNVATVSTTGWVQAIAAGTATIGIIANPGQAPGQAVVTVSARP